MAGADSQDQEGDWLDWQRPVTWDSIRSASRVTSQLGQPLIIRYVMVAVPPNRSPHLNTRLSWLMSKPELVP